MAHTMIVVHDHHCVLQHPEYMYYIGHQAAAAVFAPQHLHASCEMKCVVADTTPFLVTDTAAL
jgi:hypothetical protein